MLHHAVWRADRVVNNGLERVFETQARLGPGCGRRIRAFLCSGDGSEIVVFVVEAVALAIGGGPLAAFLFVRCERDLGGVEQLRSVAAVKESRGLNCASILKRSGCRAPQPLLDRWFSGSPLEPRRQLDRCSDVRSIAEIGSSVEPNAAAQLRFR